MVQCAITGCQSRSDVHSRRENNIAFHRVPKDPKIHAKWLEALNKKVNDSTRICSQHFKEDDYYKSSTGKHRLLKTAIPSVNLQCSRKIHKSNNVHKFSNYNLSQIETQSETIVTAENVLESPSMPKVQVFTHVPRNEAEYPHSDSNKIKQEIEDLDDLGVMDKTEPEIQEHSRVLNNETEYTQSHTFIIEAEDVKFEVSNANLETIIQSEVITYTHSPKNETDSNKLLSETQDKNIETPLVRKLKNKVQMLRLINKKRLQRIACLQQRNRKLIRRNVCLRQALEKCHKVPREYKN